MTRLFNLESYPEICRYTQIFGESLSLNSSNVPFAYRDFLNTYRDRLFLSPANLLSHCSNALTWGEYKPQLLGDKLDDEQQGDLVIVRDIDVLSLQNLDCPYIYASAYRYWNYITQLQNIAKEGKPLVIYDLDSLPCPYYLPISFQSHPNCSYPIPILDIRTPENHDSLRISFDTSNTYDTICETLARNIIVSDPNFVDIEAFSLAQHLKKINILNIIKDCLINNPSQEIISLLIDFSNVDNTNLYLKVELPLKIVENIVLNVVPAARLKEIVQNNPEYNFVLISQYSCLSNFRFSLESHFFLPDTSCPEFSDIWQRKQSHDFPLYGQFLDQISFKVGEDWLDVPSELDYDINSCIYEGESNMRKFIGKYLKDNEIINEFIMDKKLAELPIKINGKSIKKVEKEQAYQLKNLFFDENPEIKVKINFYIRLGNPPILQIEDEYNRKINCEFVNAKEIEIKGLLSIREIIDTRINNSYDKIFSLDNFDFSGFRSCLAEINQSLISKNFNRLKTRIYHSGRYVHRNRQQREQGMGSDPLMYIDPRIEEKKVLSIYDYLKNNCLIQFAKLLLELLEKPNDLNSFDGEIIKEGIFLLGKIYMFSMAIGEEIILRFFQKNFLTKISNYCDPSDGRSRLILMDEYWRFLSRVASKPKLQIAYFSLFFEKLKYGEAYISDVYLWGYSRILLWYSEFDYHNYVDYKIHAKAIIERLKSIPPSSKNYYQRKSKIDDSNYQYKQNAFLSLIYLLTFRSKDSKFFDKHTSDFDNAQELIRQIEGRNERIILKVVSKTNTLPQIYANFLNQVETFEDKEGLKKIE